MYIRVLKEIDFISFHILFEKKIWKFYFFLLLSLSNLRFEEKIYEEKDMKRLTIALWF